MAPISMLMPFGSDSALFLLGLLIGVWLPDIDLAIPYLPHRSALTHSVLPGLALLWLNQRPLAAGLLAGIAIHLAADLFPHHWRGGALIYVPFAGGIGLWSIPFMAGNIAGALWLADRIMQRPGLASTPVAATCVLAVAYLLLKEWSVLGLASLTAIAWALRRFV